MGPDKYLPKSWIFSKWIKNDPSFLLKKNEKRNYFSFKAVEKDYKSKFNLKAFVCYIGSDGFEFKEINIKISRSPLLEDHFKSELGEFGKFNANFFKILIQIIPNDPNSKIHIEFTSLVIGDPCEVESVCSGNGVCESKIPNDEKVVCTCLDKFGGENCQFDSSCKAVSLKISKNFQAFDTFFINFKNSSYISL